MAISLSATCLALNLGLVGALVFSQTHVPSLTTMLTFDAMTASFRHYRVAQESLDCYLKSANYTFKLVDLDHDPRVNQHCKHDQVHPISTQSVYNAWL